jgi:uncharacterized membrane protein YfcA
VQNSHVYTAFSSFFVTMTAARSHALIKTRPASRGCSMIDPLYSLSGFAVGLLVGMTSVGGGALMTPILI